MFCFKTCHILYKYLTNCYDVACSVAVATGREKEARLEGGSGIYGRFRGRQTPGKGCEMSSRQVKFVINLCRAEDQRRQQQLQANSNILKRLGKLPPADQNLLNLAIPRKHSFRQIATLVGSNPGSVCRRVTMLTRRLSHPLVIALMERPLGLSEKFIDIGLRRHLFHQGIRSIAAAVGCTAKEVYSILHFLERWLRMSRQYQQNQKGELQCAENL